MPKFTCKQFGAIIAVALTGLAARAEVTPFGLFNSGMVLPRNVPVNIWGAADAGESVSVSFAGQNAATVADANGKWSVQLAAMNANKTGQTMTITGKNTITLTDILVGDVWLCAGQSNMALQYYDDNNIIAPYVSEADNYPTIRSINGKANVETFAAQSPWVVAGSTTFKKITMAGYFFARRLVNELDVPIGLVDTSIPGIGIEAFLGSTYSTYNRSIAPFGFKGAIWYQGESNAGDNEAYRFKMKQLVGEWRDALAQPALPFFYVQLSTYSGSNYAPIREGQRMALTMIPEPVGMAVAVDVGLFGNLHPYNKYDVGERLAVWALNKTYGKTDVVTSGPLYKSLVTEGNKARLKFDYADGLKLGNKKGGIEFVDDPAPTMSDVVGKFQVAGSDGTWHTADSVEFSGGDVLVSSASVASPTAVRYAYEANPSGVFIYNSANLPMVPFRTDYNADDYGTAPDWTPKPEVQVSLLSPLGYTGTLQTGIVAKVGYRLSGDFAATAVGDYTATVTLEEGYQWSDRLKEPSRTVTWSIVEDLPSVGVQLWEDGPEWAMCNIGATTTEGYGEIFRFDAASNAVEEALGAPWRVPTDAELLALKDNCDMVWTNHNGVVGCLFMSKSNGKSIFLPAAGCLHGNARDDIGVRGCYWSSVALNEEYVFYLSVGSGSIQRNWTGRLAAGGSVRAVRDAGGSDEPEVPGGEEGPTEPGPTEPEPTEPEPTEPEPTEPDPVVAAINFTTVNGFAEALATNANLVSAAPAEGGDYILALENSDGSTDYVHVFTTVGEATFTTSDDLTARVMLVGGGGSGSSSYTYGGGGGGAGGLVEKTGFSLSAGSYDITVGAGGGKPNEWWDPGKNGGDSSITSQFSDSSTSQLPLTAPGGGRGGLLVQAVTAAGNGGCGGGAAGVKAGMTGDVLGGTGNPGKDGGSATVGVACSGSGGGGMGTSGESATGEKSGNGGDGVVNDITGSPIYYAGGGAGGSTKLYGKGGLGGGGDAKSGTGNNGANGLGGGGAGGSLAMGIGGVGGSGVVIIRYKVSGVPTAKVPTAKTGLVYTGAAQTGVEAKTGSTLAGDFSATDAGEYTATATLEDGYVWADAYAESSRTISWSITKATPVVSGTLVMASWQEGETASEPSGLSADFGEIVYNYYSDAECTAVIAKPTAAGTYYVRGEVAESDNWNEAVSEAKAFAVIEAGGVDPTVEPINFTTVNGFAEALATNANLVSAAPAAGGDYILALENSDGSTDYVHVFTTVGEATFTTSDDLTARVMLVGGGGSGASVSVGGGGGGGAGGLVEKTGFSLSAGSYDIVVGEGGGKPNQWWDPGKVGGKTSLSSGGAELLNAPGGGGGGVRYVAVTAAGNGGCGGGATGVDEKVTGEALGGKGDPGKDGGSATMGVYCSGSGGGGMGTAGNGPDGMNSGSGGDGVVSDITGQAIYYAGGGAGGSMAKLYGTGGLGGGGDAKSGTGNDGANGLGGGGAGGSVNSGIGGVGGSGVVIIRYKVSGVPTAKVPTAKTDLVYTGTEQTGVEAKTGSTLAGDFSATDAGEYTATATLENGYVWADAYAESSRTITWSIAKATPVVSGTLVMASWQEGETASEPSGLTADFGEIVYNYYSDAECTAVIAKPTAAGTYYVRGEVAESDNWNEAVSEAKMFAVIEAGGVDPTIEPINFTTVNGFVEALATNANLVSAAPAAGGDYILALENDDGSTDYVHVFTTVGAATFTTSGDLTARVLLVGGGGGGASGGNYFARAQTGGSGGGAGGLVDETGFSLSAGSYDIVVGAGGVGHDVLGNGGKGENGANSVLSLGGENLLVAKGGGGGVWDGNGQDGGCGGGAGGHLENGTSGVGGAGSVGGDGGSAGPTEVKCSASGGGGMGAAGEGSTGEKAGDGGNGVVKDITGCPVYYAGGGAGASFTGKASDYGKGGLGGGASAQNGAGKNGANGLGGGASGAFGGNNSGGNGGSGVVIIRYTVSGSVILKAVVPTAKTGLVYTGVEQVGVVEEEGSELSGVAAATQVGDYVATATLKDGYEWLDGYEQTSRTIEWSIAKGMPTFSGKIAITDWNMGETPSEPEGLSVDFGELVYRYYADADCTEQIDKPTDQPGVYYVRGEVAGADDWNAAISEVKRFRVVDPNVINYTGVGDFYTALSNSPNRVTEAPAQGGDVILKLKNPGQPAEYVHIFLTPGAEATFTTEKRINAQVLLVGGGGGGAGGGSYFGRTSTGGGGGGAGGLRQELHYRLAAGDYTVTVGAGGAGCECLGQYASNGGDSALASGGETLLKALGGGGGSTYNQAGRGGGCGGGAGGRNENETAYAGGNGELGFDGGSGKEGVKCAGSGGGGMGAVGESSTGEKSGDGGDGTVNDITGLPIWYAGGGAGGTFGTLYGKGGFGGGGSAANGAGGNGVNGLGGGGAGGKGIAAGGNGGNGIVIIRYKVRKGLIFVIK